MSRPTSKSRLFPHKIPNKKTLTFERYEDRSLFACNPFGCDAPVPGDNIDFADVSPGISLSSAAIQENLSGVEVGVLSARDEGPGQSRVFTTNEPTFEIVDRTLKLKDDQFANLDDGSTINIEVIATDTSLSPRAFAQNLVITVIANPHPWSNVSQPLDTNGDGVIVPQDALRIINQLNDPTVLKAGDRLPEFRPANSTLPYYDTNGDGFCTPLDALGVINFLNNQQGVLAAQRTEQSSEIQPFLARSANTLSKPAPMEQTASSPLGLPNLGIGQQAITLEQPSHEKPSQEQPWSFTQSWNPVAPDIEDLLDPLAQELAARSL